jgi:hypothetical protein
VLQNLKLIRNKKANTMRKTETVAALIRKIPQTSSSAFLPKVPSSSMKTKRMVPLGPPGL